MERSNEARIAFRNERAIMQQRWWHRLQYLVEHDDFSAGVSEDELIEVIQNGGKTREEDLAYRIFDAGIGEDGDSLLLFAARNGYNRAARLLLERGDDVNAANLFHETTLMVASRYPGTMEILIQYGADVNARQDGGVTVMMRAAYSGKLESVRLLAEHGADLNAVDKRGRTAIMRLIEKAGEPAIENIEVLLQLGATPNIANPQTGSMALTMAKREHYNLLAHLLRQYGAEET